MPSIPLAASPSILLEVCIDSVSGALAAETAGADRLELCAALAEGGLTPSAALMRHVCQSTKLPVMAMMRPRGGGFVYDATEIAIMCDDIDGARDAGVTGFVFGALNPARQVDVDACRRLLQYAAGADCTFHRAFDLCADPKTALRQLIDLGFSRLLTSGQAATAELGAARIRQCVCDAGNGLRVMAGAGITPDNVQQVVMATGVRDIHGSASAWHPDASNLSVLSGESGRRRVTSQTVVAQLRQRLDEITATEMGAEISRDPAR